MRATSTARGSARRRRTSCYPGQVPEMPARELAGGSSDALVCATRIMRLGERPARDEAILSSLRQTVGRDHPAGERALVRERSPGTWTPSIRTRRWRRRSPWRRGPISAERGRRVSDRVPVLAAGDIAVLGRMPPREAYPLACARYLAHQALGAEDVFLGLMILDPRETALHAGRLCRRRVEMAAVKRALCSSRWSSRWPCRRRAALGADSAVADAQRAQIEALRGQVAAQIQLQAYDLLDELVFGWNQQPVFAVETPWCSPTSACRWAWAPGCRRSSRTTWWRSWRRTPAPTCSSCIARPACRWWSTREPRGPSSRAGWTSRRRCRRPGPLSTSRHALFLDFEAEGAALVLRARITSLEPALPIVYAKTLSTTTASPALLRSGAHLKSAAEARQEYLEALERRGAYQVPIEMGVRTYASGPRAGHVAAFRLAAGRGGGVAQPGAGLDGEPHPGRELGAGAATSAGSPRGGSARLLSGSGELADASRPVRLSRRRGDLHAWTERPALPGRRSRPGDAHRAGPGRRSRAPPSAPSSSGSSSG